MARFLVRGISRYSFAGYESANGIFTIPDGPETEAFRKAWRKAPSHIQDLITEVSERDAFGRERAVRGIADSGGLRPEGSMIPNETRKSVSEKELRQIAEQSGDQPENRQKNSEPKTGAAMGGQPAGEVTGEATDQPTPKTAAATKPAIQVSLKPKS